MINLASAPDNMLASTQCSCKKSKCSSTRSTSKARCDCQENGMSCTDLCTCLSCSNKQSSTDSADDYEVEDCLDDVER